jgi:hypothetical protein
VALGVQAMKTHLALSAALMLALAGCATSDNDAFRLGGLIFQSITGGPTITREQAASIPYASLGVQLGNSGQGVAVLGRRAGEDRYWFSGETVVLVTRAGRVVETAGLPYDLTRLQVRAPTGTGAPGTAREYMLLYDLRSLGAYNVAARCTDTDEGAQTITILGTAIVTRYHVERCNAEQIGWSFENEYWLDPKTGFVWQSVQDIHPRSPKLYISVFRPESGRAPASPPAQPQPAQPAQ